MLVAFVNKLENNEKVMNKEEKLMIKVLALLQRKSKKALEKAKKLILSERIESKRAREALQYYVKNWNDTTHPGILGLACEAVGGNLRIAEPMQIVTLYLAASADLHDDIIDNSTFKNGKPTVFGKYGKDITMLLGNAMLIKGFTLLYDYSKKLESEKFEKIVQTIKDELFELGNAHLLEVELRSINVPPPEQYMKILRKKASSIRINTKIGAIIGGGSSTDIKKLERYGEILGILIGLREEFIDIFEPEELRNRIKNEILPLPLLLTIKDQKTKNEVLQILSKPKISEEDVQKIVDHVFQNNDVKKLKMYMQDLRNKALAIVNEIKDKRVRDKLALIINGSLEDL